jgi:hypothetical protein
MGEVKVVNVETDVAHQVQDASLKIRTCSRPFCVSANTISIGKRLRNECQECIDKD